jgi:hypothetical protein
MKHVLVKALAAFICLSPVVTFAYSKMGDGPTLQILMENGNPMIINASGEKTNLTLGTFTSAAIEAGYSDVKAAPANKLDPKAIAYIRIAKVNGKPEITVFDNANRSEPLDLGVFIAAAAQTYPGCNADQINGKKVSIDLSFKKNDKGNVETYFTKANGKEIPFNLGVLLADTTIALNDCK